MAKKLNVRSLKDSETKMHKVWSLVCKNSLTSYFPPTNGVSWRRPSEQGQLKPYLLFTTDARIGLTAITKKSRSWFKRRIKSTRLILKMRKTSEEKKHSRTVVTDSHANCGKSRINGGRSKATWYKNMQFDGKIKNSLKAIYGPRIESARLLLDPLSNIPPSQPEDIMKIWRDHFCWLLNQPSSIDWPTIEALTQHETKNSLARERSLSQV